MPYRKRTARKPTYRRKRISTRRFKSRVTRVVRQITEHKRSEFTAIAYHSSIGSTWTELDPINVVNQGPAINQRIGNTVAITSLHIKGVMWGGAIGSVTGDDLYNTVRFVVYTVKNQTSGGSLTPLLSSSPAITLHTPIRKENVKGLIKVYRDKFIAFHNAPVDADTASPGSRNIDIYLKFPRPIRVTYDATTGAMRNDVHLFVSAISDSAAVPNPGFNSGWITVNYIDV